MKPDAVKQALHDTIQSMTDCKWLFSVRPGKDNTRNRKFPFHKVISSILAFRGGTLSRDISDTMCETIITNLDSDLFPLADIKRLYAMRWGIETSFRALKHTLGLLHLHAKKVEFVHQEVFAKLTMYNFCEMITRSVVIQQKQRKYAYKVNFSDAVHIALQFFLGEVPPHILEALLMKYISPIRPGRKDTRKLTQKPSVSFTYRVA
ncbi:MAG: transposase [Clostridiales bacterium]|nr:transposase [Clostridiales bacterium]